MPITTVIRFSKVVRKSFSIKFLGKQCCQQIVMVLLVCLANVGASAGQAFRILVKFDLTTNGASPTVRLSKDSMAFFTEQPCGVALRRRGQSSRSAQRVY